MRSSRRLVTVVLWLLSAALPLAARAGEGATQVTIYYSPTCSHCTEFLETVWPAIAEEFGARIAVTMVDVHEAQGLATLEAEEARLGVSAPDIPVVGVEDPLLFDLDVARLGEATRIEVNNLHRSWGGRRAVAPDGAPVIGFDPAAEGVFWLVVQGGYGIQSAPALSRTAAAMVLGAKLPQDVLDAGLVLADTAP